MIEEHNIEAVTVHNSTARANVMESSLITPTAGVEQSPTSIVPAPDSS
jgi:hypothetical protein